MTVIEFSNSSEEDLTTTFDEEDDKLVELAISKLLLIIDGQLIGLMTVVNDKLCKLLGRLEEGIPFIGLGIESSSTSKAARVAVKFVEERSNAKALPVAVKLKLPVSVIVVED